jgi:hypothetical protein
MHGPLNIKLPMEVYFLIHEVKILQQNIEIGYDSSLHLLYITSLTNNHFS